MTSEEQDLNVLDYLILKMQQEALPIYHEVSEIFKVAALVQVLQEKGMDAEHVSAIWVPIKPDNLALPLINVVRLHKQVRGPTGANTWKSIAISELGEKQGRGSLGNSSVLENMLLYYTKPGSELRERLFDVVRQGIGILDQHTLNQSSPSVYTSFRPSLRL